MLTRSNIQLEIFNINMTLKKYHLIRSLTAFVVALVFSQSLILKSPLLSVFTIIMAWVVLTYLRSKVSEIIADERDFQISGQAAFKSIQAFSLFSVFISVFLYFNRQINPTFEPVAVTLAYSTCFLMLVYSLYFKFHDWLLIAKNKKLIYLLIVIILICFSIFSLRLFSGEDTWVCQNGSWQKHGQPSFPAPSINCQP